MRWAEIGFALGVAGFILAAVLLPVLLGRLLPTSPVARRIVGLGAIILAATNFLVMLSHWSEGGLKGGMAIGSSLLSLCLVYVVLRLSAASGVHKPRH